MESRAIGYIVTFLVQWTKDMRRVHDKWPVANYIAAMSWKWNERQIFRIRRPELKTGIQAVGLTAKKNSLLLPISRSCLWWRERSQGCWQQGGCEDITAIKWPAHLMAVISSQPPCRYPNSNTGVLEDERGKMKEGRSEREREREWSCLAIVSLVVNADLLPQASTQHQPIRLFINLEVEVEWKWLQIRDIHAFI